MIPIVDVIRPRKTPWVSLALIALAAGVLAGEFGLADNDLRSIVHAWGLVPEAPHAMASLTSLLLVPGPLWTLSHAAALWFFGPNVEDRFGRLRFALLYLAAGAAGNFAEVWFNPSSPFPIIGAAGAAGGVIGAYFVLVPASRILFLLPLPLSRSFDAVEAPAALLVGVWFLLQAIGADANLTRTFVLGAPPVAAQIAGAAIGGATVFVLRKPLRMNWSEERV